MSKTKATQYPRSEIDEIHCHEGKQVTISLITTHMEVKTVLWALKQGSYIWCRLRASDTACFHAASLKLSALCNYRTALFNSPSTINDL